MQSKRLESQVGVTERSQDSTNKIQHEIDMKHTKEDVDAGNTLLDFLKELKKNHEKALFMSDQNISNYGSKGEHTMAPSADGSVNASSVRTTMSANTASSGIRGNMSVSTAGLVSEMPQISSNSRFDYSDTSSSLSGDTRSLYMKQDESIKSESSSDCALSEDDQKIHKLSNQHGPIRKRFRRN